jgi:hypothetical protein
MGLFALLSLMLDFVPLIMAIAYVIRPTEQRLALMRPLSLVGLFSALAGGIVGLLNVLRGAATAQQGFTGETYRIMAIGAAESLVAVFVGFACLSAAWLLVAAGMARQHARI